MTRPSSIVAAFAALLAGAGLASAQPPFVLPDGTPSEPTPAPTQPAAPAGAQPAPGAPAQPGAPATGGYYHTDGAGEDGDIDDPTIVRHNGAVPSVHVVRPGDTLWDISSLYFSNAWEWPRVWSYNPEITNPHWIYPGDQVRLGGAGGAPAVTAAIQDGGPVPSEPVRDGGFELRQLAFVSAEDLKIATKVDGSPEEKVLLSTRDEVYLSYPAGHPPLVGKRYSVYLERKRVFHPRDKDREVGAYVRVIGEIEVISVMKGKRARGVIVDAVDVIERGMKVGPLVRQFRTVEPVPGKVDLEATIVAELQTSEKLIGARQVVFIDKGSAHGVVVGNEMEVIRRGDAYEDLGARFSEGKNDRRYPASSLGRILVVQVGKRASIAVVSHSRKEIGVGDLVLLVRRGR